MRKGFAGAAVPTTVASNVTAGLPNATNGLTANQASLETDTTGWEVDSNCTIARSTAQALDGVASLSLTSLAAGEMKVRTTYATWVPVTVGMSYQASAWYRAATAPRSCLTLINWFTASDGYVATSGGTSVFDTTTGWTRSVTTAVAPATAAKAQVIPDVLGAGAAGEVHYIDRIAFNSVITLSDDTGWVFTTTPFVVVIDRGLPTEEKILCSEINDSSLLIAQRGYDSTTAAAHTAGVSEVVHVLDSITIDEANAHVESGGSPNLVTVDDATFLEGTGAWAASSTASTVARSTTEKAHGAASLSLTRASTIGAAAAVTEYWTFPVTPGRTYTALFSVKAATVGRTVAVDIDWYNNTDGYISSSRVTSADVTTGWTTIIDTATAPANAAQVKLYVEVASVAVGELHYIDKVGLFEGTVTTWELPPYSPVAPVNLLTPNQASIEVDTSGWYYDVDWATTTTVARSTTVSLHGIASLQFTNATGGTGDPGVTTARRWTAGQVGVPVTAGELYTAVAFVRAGTVSRMANIDVYWYDRQGEQFDNAVGPKWNVPLSTTIWTRLVHRAVAPAGAAYATVHVAIDNAGASESFYLDQASFHRGGSVEWRYPPEPVTQLEPLIYMGVV